MAAVATGHSHYHRARQEAGRPYHVPPRPMKPCSAASRPEKTSPSKLEKSRAQAQQRRMTQKGLMDELAALLPFPKEVTSQMDTKTVLRLALCYLRLKSLLSECGSSCTPAVGGLDTDWHHLPAATEQEAAMESCRSQPMATWDLAAGGNGLVSRRSVGSPLGAEIFQDLLVEALQGFLMVVSCDGTVLYLSKSVFAHTGLFQSEHTGSSLYNLVHEEDHSDVREALTAAEAAALTSGVAPCSFFCRMRNREKKSHLKTPGYKLVYVSGHCKIHLLEPYVACTVHVVSAPSILEIRMEGNSFITRHDMEMRVIFYDGRLSDVLGYSKKNLIGKSLFSLHHHDDLTVTETCSQKVREKGESVTGYYRFLTHHGSYVWLQTRGTMVVDRRTGKPSQIICVHFVVEKSRGDHSLTLRNMLADQPSTISLDPVPVPRWDGELLNPLSQTEHKLQLEHTAPSVPTVSHSSLANGTSTDLSSRTISPNSVDGFSIDCGRQQSSPPLHVHQDASHVQCDASGAEFASEQAMMACADTDLFEQYFTSQQCAALIDPSLSDTKCDAWFSSSKGISDAPVIELSPFQCSPLVMSEGDQLHPLPTPSHAPSSCFSTIPGGTLTPFSNHSIPVTSPYWPAENSPFPHTRSNSTSPHSSLGSNTTSPHSMSNHALNFDSTTLDPVCVLLDDLLGPDNVSDGSTSPDSGCTELETYLISLTSAWPSHIPASSPAASSAVPSPLDSSTFSSPHNHITHNSYPANRHLSQTHPLLIRDLLSLPLPHPHGHLLSKT